MVLDGCSEGTEHYIGVSAAYTKMDKTSTSMDVPVQEMLSVRLLLVDATKGMTAAGHLQHIMLNHVELNGKGCGKQLFSIVVGDNCIVSHTSLARTLRVPLIGCDSHKQAEVCGEDVDPE